jgi:hypothetical protein
MIRSRLGLKALVLSGLLLGLMAFASSAQAEVGANWRVNGTNVNSTLLPQLEISEIENKTVSLLFVTKSLTHVEILCTVAKFGGGGGKLTTNGSLTLGDVLFTGCVVLLNHELAAKCKAHSPGKPVGEILTENGTGLIVLHKSASGVVTDAVLIKADNEKGLFANIEMGETCAIGESVNVNGELWIEDGGGNAGFEKEEVIHLIKEGPLFGLTALGQPAKIIGSAKVILTGAHVGLKWSGKPA